MIAISQNLFVKNDLLLIRYTLFKDKFDVSHDYFMSKKESELKFNGTDFKDEDRLV